MYLREFLFHINPEPFQKGFTQFAYSRLLIKSLIDLKLSKLPHFEVM